MANPVGRPRTTINDLPDDWQEIMIDISQEGGSKIEAMAKLGIYKSAWATLQEDSPEFQATVEKCDMLCQTWWEAQGRKMTTGAQGSAVVWKFNMQNRFNWREKMESDLSNKDGSLNQEINDQDFKDKLEELGINVK